MPEPELKADVEQRIQGSEAAKESKTLAEIVLEDDSPTSDVAMPLSQVQFGLLLACLFCVCVLAALDNLIVSTAIRSIVIDIGKQELAPWIGSAYMITSAGLTPLYGRFADIFGRKPMLLFAIALFEIGSLVCAVAQSMETLIVAGIGGGGLGSLVLIIMSEIVTIRERAKYQGMLGAAIGLSSIMGPLVGGLFMVRFPVVSSDKSLLERLRQLDWLGVITLFLAIMFFVTPLQLGGSLWEWNSAPVLTMLPLSVVLLALFVWIEKRARNPIIPSSLFVHANTALLLVYSLALGAIFFSGAYYISLFFQIVFGKSASDAGVTALPLSFGMVSATVGSGIVVSKRGRYISLFYAGPVLMIIGCALTSFLDANSPLIQQIGVMFIFGFGGGLVYQTRVVAMQLSVKTELIAVATSVSTTCFLLGGAVGISITGTIINNLITQITDTMEDLRTVIQILEKFGFHVSTREVLATLESLARLAKKYPQYLSIVSKSTSSLIQAFNDAFKVAYLSMITYAVLMLVLAFGMKHIAPTKKVDPVVE
ncbi:hypothetical protein HDU99_000190 [Rhizoclosmatium hyalinum]|nr:hypothetical protein HDU99_000190 [Rhizoclosmatium hyalinum]